MLTETVLSVAESAGKRAAADWPFMEAEDITQQLLLEACTRPDTYNSMNPGHLAEAFRRRAVAYCARERADYVTRTARYLYTPGEVSELLTIAVETVGVDFDAPSVDGYVAAPDKGNVCVSLLDLRRALDTIPDAWRRLLLRRAESEGLTAEQRKALAETGWAPLTETEKRTARRAIDRLTEVLNRTVNRTAVEHDGPGARRAIPNGRAYAVTHDERDGN